MKILILKTTTVWLLKPKTLWSLQSALKGTDTVRPLVSVETIVQMHITQGEAEHCTEHDSEGFFLISGKRSA